MACETCKFLRQMGVKNLCDECFEALLSGSQGRTDG